MRLEACIERFDALADAPDALAKIRQLILELAVQGKLVDQNPGEGDGHALLREIRKKNPPSGMDAEAERAVTELPTLPGSWAIAKLGEVTDIIRGVSFPGSAKSGTCSDGDVACLRTASVQEEIDWDDLIYIPAGHVGRTDQWVTPNDVIISMANSYALVGKVAIVRRVPQQATFGAFLAAIRPILIEPYFLLYALRSPRMQAAFRASSSQTTNIANISLGRMRPMPFPLPPLGEQKRIVAKVDVLMALCNRLESQQQERQTRHAALSRAALARFTDAPSPANTQFLFHPSFTVPPADIRKSILNLAIQGKLIPQRPGESTRKQLRSAKDAKIAAKGTSQAIWISDNTPAEPFAIPSNWSWMCIGDAIEMTNGRAFKASEWSTSGMPIVRIQNLNNEEATFNHYDGDFDPRHRIETGTFLISWSGTPGTSFGAFIWLRGEALLNQHIFKCEFYGDAFEPMYLALSINARLDEMISHAQGGVGLRHITKGKLEAISIPLPPLPEQRRIMAKVDQLMSVVGRLEKHLERAEFTAGRLLEALIAQLTRRRATP